MENDTEARLAQAYADLGPAPRTRERMLAGLPTERRKPGRRGLVPALVLLCVAAVLAATVASRPTENPSASEGPLLHFRTAGEIDATASVMSARLAARGIDDAEVLPAEAPGELEVVLPVGAAAPEVAAMLARPGTLEFRLVAPEGTEPGQGLRWAEDARGGPPLLLEDPRESADFFGGDDIDPAAVEARPGREGWIVTFAMRDDRKADFGSFTARSIKRLLAIVVDGKVESAPMIQSKLPGSGQISGGGMGGFTQEEAESLAAVLRSGPLPGPVEQVHPPREKR